MITPSGAGKDHSPFFDIVKFLLLAGLLVWLLVLGTDRLGYHWQWYRIPRYILSLEASQLVPGPLLKGFIVTLRITAGSMILAFLIALITAIFRLSDSFMARALARTYLEIIRNTPLLIQIFFIYFVISPIFNLDAFTSAVLALSLFEGAYASEIIRAGIVSIPKDQWEAAASLGISAFNTYRHIILPQALRRVLPPLAGQAVSLIKDSALVSTIAIYDLTMQGQAIVAETFLTFEVWFTVAAIYLLVTISLSFLVRILENRMNKRFA